MKISLFLFAPCLSFAHLCLFTPPPDWETAKPQKGSEVEVGFIGRGQKEFRPSINLISEEIDCDLKQYVKAVKKIHLAEPGTRWQDLGPLHTKGGEGRLTEIRTPSSFGELHLFQAIFVKEKKAYILTAALSKEDLPSLQKEVLESFASLNFYPDLWSAVPEKTLRLNLLSTLEKGAADPKSRWESLQTLVLKEGAALGSYWQFLALKEGYAKISP